MMIPILTDYYEAGYITQPRYKTLTAFFPNCNLAIRRTVIDEIGLYDEHCSICGEDADICHRTAAGGWELFYERGASCHHEARRGMATIVKQWFWYGYEGGYFFQKWQEHPCEIFVSLDARPRINHYKRLLHTDITPFRILFSFLLHPLSPIASHDSSLSVCRMEYPRPPIYRRAGCSDGCGLRQESPA